MTQARRLFFLILCLAVGQVLIAQTYTTVALGSWDVATTWDVNGIPPNPIPTTATVEINHNVSTGISKTNNGIINMNGTAFTLFGGATLTNNGTLNAANNFSNGLTVNFGCTIDNYGLITMETVRIQFFTGTFNNKSGGILETKDGNSVVFQRGNSIFNNEAGAKMDLANGGRFEQYFLSTGNVLNNEGTIYTDGGGSISIYNTFDNKAGGVVHNGGFIRGASYQNSVSEIINEGAIKSSSNLYGRIMIASMFTAKAGSSLEWILSASPNSFDSNYPYIEVESGATVDFANSSFAVSLATGFEPNTGDIYNIYRGPSVPTNPISLPTLSGEKTWKDSRPPTVTDLIQLEVEEPCEPTPITCPGNIVKSNDAGNCGAIVTFTLPDGASATPTSGSFFPVGTTTVNVEGSDGCDGTSTCSFTVTVNDTEDPSISCPADFSVDTDDGECGADVYLPAPGASDNCQVADVQGKYRLVDEDNDPISDFFSGRVDDPSGFLAVGRYQVNWRARDIYGNRDFCSYYVEVVDDEDPEAVCKDVTVNFNGEYSIDLAVSQVWNEAASSDNCGSVHYVGTSPSLSISCADLGSVVPLTVTIRDDEGNTDQCTADVTVTGLPCGWSEGDDDGSLNCAGNTDVDYDVNDESFAVSADGCWHDCRESDKAAYVYQTLCGDGTLTARLASINTKGYAGLMLRESLDPDARRAGALKNFSTRRVRREYRSTYGGIVTQRHSNRSRVKWFRIVRKGNEVKSYTSTNGSYWRLLYRVVFPNLEDCVYIGMMAYSSNTSSTVDAVFDNVSFSGSGNSLIDNNASLPNSFTILDHDLEINQAEVNIFPNPSSGQSQIELNGFSEAPAQIWIRDAFGKVVRQIELDYPDGAMLPLDLQDMPTGLYLISVMQEQQEVITKKLMIQK